jgi:hypothetical protein
MFVGGQSSACRPVAEVKATFTTGQHQVMAITAVSGIARPGRVRSRGAYAALERG